MSDPIVTVDPGQKGNANLVYILYLCSFLIGVSALVGVVMAYVGKSTASPLVQSHYENQINIFWKMFLFMVIGAVLTLLVVGILIILAAIVWYVIRVVKGMQALSSGEIITNPESWGI
ncbi:DUF4870 family protein [Henriciella marina]|uniref:DUF4870 family protein n=1 Tax=Henriciella marina TaxID=453851 RepID=UPI00037780A5|nr:DUF4870 domain-containing protein [Henriciella marina]